MPTRNAQDDLLAAEALLAYAHDLGDVHPGRADRAQTLATDLVESHGLMLEELPRQIDWSYHS